jgi:2-oxoglutarate dehydrogenase E2 component (dihydrolipoamide succinyltransferase)
VTEGTVTQWLKQVGDEVAVDEALLEVSTDKVDTEIPSPVAGTLLEIRVDTDETVGVGTVLAVIGSGSPDSGTSTSGAEGKASDESTEDETSAATAETSDAEPSDEGTEDEESRADQEPEAEPQPESRPSPDRAPVAEEKPAAEAAPPRPSAAPSPVGDGAPAYVTPLVRKLAAQHDVDLATVTGSGVGGRIRKQDVLAAAEASKQAPAAEPAAAPTSAPAATATEPSPLRGKTEKLSRLRQVIARRMVESLQTSAQLTTVVEVDVTSISRMRARHKASFEQREGVKLSFLPFFAKAAVDALKIYPQLNASIDTEKNEVTYAPSENLGVAVDTERGLLVATVRDAGDLSIPGLARKIADLAERTRTNKITPDELSGATFTLTNTGSRGALFDTPIIFQPQVAILGTGAVVKRAVVIDDPNLGETIAVRQMVYLALTYDHRLVDGADAARFLSAVKQRLEEANFEGDLV